MKMKTMLMGGLLLGAVVLAPVVSAAELPPLQLAGYLGNSGEGDTLVAFSGQAASGIGPVLDDANTLWERGGSKQLNRYALDGRLLASFELPDSNDRSDQMARAGEFLVMKLRRSLYTLPLNAAPGTNPQRLPGEAEVMSANSFAGKVVIYDKGELFWLEAATGARAIIVKPGGISALFIGTNGTVYGFGDGRVNAWANSQTLPGFPKGFNGERPQKLGRYWFSHTWHGTINRMNEAFEPEPGVVLGGASGTFIGYLPASADLLNGRGMVQLVDGGYAVSGAGGVIQFLQWVEAESRFNVVRRIGALAGINAVALDAAGNIWTPRGSWRWGDTSDRPATLGDKEPDVCAQPVMLGGKTICLLKKHYNYVQLARGPLIDEAGLSHFETPGIKDFELPDAITGAAVFEEGKSLRLVAVERSGKVFELGITANGQQESKPEPVVIPGLKNCTSLAWFEGKLLAADDRTVIVFERTAERGWRELSRLSGFGGGVFVHSDGKRFAVSDAGRGEVRLQESLAGKPAVFAGLNKPMNIAVSGDRVVVYEAGRQRLAKLELGVIQPATALVVRTAPTMTGRPVAHTDADYQSLGRPGGVPLAVAMTQTPDGIAVSIRTKAAPVPQIKLGLAMDQQAYLLGNAQARQSGGQFDFKLPPWEWSKLRFAAAIKYPDQQERFGFADHQAIHAAFNSNPAAWAPFDLEAYREAVAERKQEIRLEFEQPVEGKTTVVIEDELGGRVRNLVSGRSFMAGNQALVWDGLDEAGKLVTPGSYRWRGITHPGIEPVYLMNFANGGEATTEPWGPNHSTLHHAAANREWVFFAAPVTEGGWALVALDSEGRLVQGYEHQQGLGIGHDAIAADDRYLYCAQDGFGWSGASGIDLSSDKWIGTWKITVVRFDIKSGKLAPFPGGKRSIEVDAMQVGPGSSHPNLKEFNLAGLAVFDGRLYVGSRDKKAVLVLDAANGQPLEKIPLEGGRHLSAAKEVFAATDRGVVRLRDQQLLIAAGKLELAGIAIAPNGDFLVSDAVSHQAHRFTAQGQPVGVIGKPGGPYQGAYDPARMVNPAGLVFGPDGKLWVTEKRWNPKRVFAWDLAKNQVVCEKFGMPHYGGDGSGFDPENPRRWIGLGCFWDVDAAKGTARPTHIMSLEEGHLGHYEPQSYTFFREAGRTFVSTRGKIALIAEVLPDGTVRDVAATANTHHFAYGFDWQPPQAYIDAFYDKWPEKRAKEKPGRKGEGKSWAQRGMGVLWVDRNGDGRPQKEEFDFCGDGIDYAGGAWGHQQNLLTFYVPVVVKKQVKIVALKPKGFLPNGVPDYPTLDAAIAQGTPVNLSPGYKRSDVATVRDRFGRFILNSDPEMNAYAADGRRLWSYPNQWSDVHGSHDAPLPEPGVMQGTLGILGIAPLDAQSDVFFLNGNHGRCFILSSDGLYLDEAFVDVRVSYLKNEYRLGGEIFGGSFGRAAASGKYYVQIGHGPYRIYELTGLQSVKRMAGTVSVSREQIAAAEKRSLRRFAARQTTREAALPGTIRWDKSGKFRAQLDLAADDIYLHLTYRVEDPSPWINNGRDWTKLFATGDTVDLQIGTNPDADPRRRGPEAGDKRLLIAPFEGKAVAVLYEHRKAGGKNPVTFTSPWRGEKVDNVQQLHEVRIEVKTEGSSYFVKALVPLKNLGLELKPGRTCRADFGVTFGDATGTDTNLRSYWANQSTGLVDDIPGEIMLTPNLWGTVSMGK